MHFQEFCDLVIAHGLLEIGHDDSIYTMEIGDCYKSRFLYFSFQRAGIESFISMPRQPYSAGHIKQEAVGGRRGRRRNSELGDRYFVVCCWSSYLVSLSELQFSHLSDGAIEIDSRRWVSGKREELLK